MLLQSVVSELVKKNEEILEEDVVWNFCWGDKR